MEQQSKTAVLDAGYVALIDTMPVADGDSEFSTLDRRVVDAARVSFNRHGDVYSQAKAVRLLRYLYEHRHNTPFEQVTLTFEVCAPMPIARQWMRHRTASYSEVSARYRPVDEAYYLPSVWRAQSDDNRQASSDDTVHLSDRAQTDVHAHMQDALDLYHDLLARGVAREQARFVLPQGMYTTFVYTVNAHNLMHFLRLRLASGAQYEMQLYAQAVLDQWTRVMPATAALFRGL